MVALFIMIDCNFVKFSTTHRSQIAHKAITCTDSHREYYKQCPEIGKNFKLFETMARVGFLSERDCDFKWLSSSSNKVMRCSQFLLPSQSLDITKNHHCYNMMTNYSVMNPHILYCMSILGQLPIIFSFVRIPTKTCSTQISRFTITYSNRISFDNVQMQFHTEFFV